MKTFNLQYFFLTFFDKCLLNCLYLLMSSDFLFKQLMPCTYLLNLNIHIDLFENHY